MKKSEGISIGAAPNPNPRARYATFLGVGLILLGFLVLAVALGQVVYTALQGFIKVPFPGSQSLELKATGLYLGVYLPEAAGTPPMADLASLGMELRDPMGASVPLGRPPQIPMVKVGARTGAMLFQVEAAEAGTFQFESAYPSGAQGPAGEIFLLHESMAQNRADIAVGVLVCLLLGGAGIYVLVSSRRRGRESPAKK